MESPYSGGEGCSQTWEQDAAPHKCSLTCRTCSNYWYCVRSGGRSETRGARQPVCGAGKAGVTAPGNERSNRGAQRPRSSLTGSGTSHVTLGVSFIKNRNKITSTRKPLCEDPMGHAKARTTWIWRPLVEAKCTSGKAFPRTSRQLRPRDKLPPQEKTSLLKKQPELWSPVCRHSRDVQWAGGSSESPSCKGAGPGLQRPAGKEAGDTLQLWEGTGCPGWHVGGSWRESSTRREGCEGAARPEASRETRGPGKPERKWEWVRGAPQGSRGGLLGHPLPPIHPSLLSWLMEYL